MAANALIKKRPSGAGDPFAMPSDFTKFIFFKVN